jgi:hypothetical protein
MTVKECTQPSDSQFDWPNLSASLELTPKLTIQYTTCFDFLNPQFLHRWKPNKPTIGVHCTVPASKYSVALFGLHSGPRVGFSLCFSLRFNMIRAVLKCKEDTFMGQDGHLQYIFTSWESPSLRREVLIISMTPLLAHSSCSSASPPYSVL